MGDMMILTDHEVKTCLVYVLTPILQKYSIEIKEAHLAIHDVIELNAIVAYQDRIIDLATTFTIGYKDHKLCFDNMKGKVEYLFLQLNVVSVLQQLIHDDHFVVHNNSCYYKIELPIQELTIEDEHLCISLKE